MKKNGSGNKFPIKKKN